MACKIVLISGCSSGMGLVTAVHLAKDEEKRFKVYATMRNLAKKGQLEEEGKECVGDTLIIKQMDVCSDESVEKAVKEVLDIEGRIDVLFNNAGVSLVSLLEWTSISKAKDIFEVNFYGPLRLIQAVLPSMKAKQSGHIINTTSTIGVIGLPFLDIYAASKFAVEGMTESMAPVLRQFNIRCTILEPGPVKTPMMQGSADAGGELDLSAADQKTQALMKTWGDITSQWFNSTLTASDVAAMIKDIILGKITSFRCQANAEPFMKGMIAAKLKDVASNEPVDIAAQKLSGGN